MFVIQFSFDCVVIWLSWIEDYLSELEFDSRWNEITTRCVAAGEVQQQVGEDFHKDQQSYFNCPVRQK